MESQACDILGHLWVFCQEEPRTMRPWLEDGNTESVLAEERGVIGQQLMFMLCCLRASPEKTMDITGSNTCL